MRKNTITSGRLLAGLFSLATPMLLQALLQNLQSIIDLYFVGGLGASAVAAVSASGTVLFILTPVLMGASVGTIAMISRFIGEGQDHLAARTVGQSITIAVFFGTLIAGIGLVFGRDLFELMNTPEEVIAEGLVYLRISLVFSFTMFILFLGNAAMQGAGDAWTPMKIMAFSNVINIILNPLLIYGPGIFPRLELAGAAWATVIAQGLAATLSLRLLSTGRLRLKMTLPDWRPNANLCWRIAKIGLPGAGQMLLRSLMNAAMFRIVAPFGTAALAGYSVSTRLNVMVLMPAFSFGNASATMVGQNLGAGRPDRAVRAAWTAVGIEVAIMVAASITLIFFAPFFLKIFLSETEAIRIGTEYFRVEAPFYIFSAVSIVLSRSMSGAGASLAPFIINAFTLWGVQVPLAYALSARLGTIGIWIAMATTQVVHALIVTIWFTLGRWKHKKI
ncbi:MAG: MATE family efflux transporter [Lentisphaerae bacterium]|nr:MATE family efflux transporter [Lentisphaerota bacterium]